MDQTERRVVLGLISSLLILSASPALGYAGPGGVVGGLGALLEIIGTLFALLVGFIWYPVKALLNKLRDTDTESTGERPLEE